MKITDTKVVTHEIKQGETYTVVYRKMRQEQTKEDIARGIRHPRPMKIEVLNGLYHNYPHDSWIGHDSEDGHCDPIKDRVYFDGEEIPFEEARKEILWVGTDSDWQNFLKERFTF